MATKKKPRSRVTLVELEGRLQQFESLVKLNNHAIHRLYEDIEGLKKSNFNRVPACTPLYALEKDDRKEGKLPNMKDGEWVSVNHYTFADNGYSVMLIRDMTTSHLANAIRFLASRGTFTAKLREMVTELEKRAHGG
jgi:hypothetical protein